MMTFGLKWKASFFTKNYRGTFLGSFWKNLGNFLFQHLVALMLINYLDETLACHICWGKHMEWIGVDMSKV